jgi:hypothetical protein
MKLSSVKVETFVVNNRCTRRNFRCCQSMEKTQLSLLTAGAEGLPFVVNNRCRRQLSLLAAGVEDLPFVVNNNCRRQLSLFSDDVENLPFVVRNRCLT